MSKRRDARQLEDRIGYRFKDRRLLLQALTHSSSTEGRGDDNERLEFLGDRVLGLIAAETVGNRHSKASVGKLAVRFNALVSTEACARAAGEIELGHWLRLGRGLKSRDGMPGKGVLADAMEALLAAVYLDGGLEPARALVAKCWANAVSKSSAVNDDPKSRLQTWALARRLGTPSYTVVQRTGPDHDPSFRVSVSVDSGESEQAIAGSKRQAELAAAEALLARLGMADD